MTLPPALCTFAGSTQSKILVPIPGNTNDVVLRNQQPDAPDTITVVPLYPEGDGVHTPDTGRTWNGEKSGQRCPSVQSDPKQPGCWLGPAPGQGLSTALCVLPWLAKGPRTCCGARKHPHGALRAAGSRRTLFREHHCALLGWRGNPSPRRGQTHEAEILPVQFPCDSVRKAGQDHAADRGI
ncbi:collagen alpha-1(XII) chain [Camelus dromedarius]|uniref:collagen alpha-1(XII) chain-like n=1 Tax=Camelus dromedarius TaxID=9838 RepID=UPI003119F673